jgi:hypothetical protein
MLKRKRRRGLAPLPPHSKELALAQLLDLGTLNRHPQIAIHNRHPQYDNPACFVLKVSLHTQSDLLGGQPYV